MISERIDLSNIFAISKSNQPVLSASKPGRSFASVFYNSMKKNSMPTGSPVDMDAQLSSEAATSKIGQLTAEAEDKFCSMCGSRIKEDGTCPICIVPVFISGNSRSFNQQISQTGSTHSTDANRVTFSYNRRKS